MELLCVYFRPLIQITAKRFAKAAANHQRGNHQNKV
jgi:hypothetical protein